MVGFSEVLCTNCNFKIIIHGVDHFYIDYKTDKLKEFMWLMRTEIDWNNEIFGHIHRTYCPSCDKIIKTYIITKSKYSKEESIHKLEDILKKSDINENDNIDFLYNHQKYHLPPIRAYKDKKDYFNNEFIEKFRENENILTKVQFEKKVDSSDFETYEEYGDFRKKMEDSKISCPKCGKQLYRSFHVEKCPICENELIYGIHTRVD